MALSVIKPPPLEKGQLKAGNFSFPTDITTSASKNNPCFTIGSPIKRESFSAKLIANDSDYNIEKGIELTRPSSPKIRFPKNTKKSEWLKRDPESMSHSLFSPDQLKTSLQSEKPRAIKYEKDRRDRTVVFKSSSTTMLAEYDTWTHKKKYVRKQGSSPAIFGTSHSRFPKSKFNLSDYMEYRQDIHKNNMLKEDGMSFTKSSTGRCGQVMRVKPMLTRERKKPVRQADVKVIAPPDCNESWLSEMIQEQQRLIEDGNLNDEKLKIAMEKLSALKKTENEKFGVIVETKKVKPRKSVATPQMIRLNISMTGFPAFSVQTKASDTLFDLKKAIERKRKKYFMERQLLIFEGIELVDDYMLLEDIPSLTHDSTLQLWLL